MSRLECYASGTQVTGVGVAAAHDHCDALTAGGSGGHAGQRGQSGCATSLDNHPQLVPQPLSSGDDRQVGHQDGFDAGGDSGGVADVSDSSRPERVGSDPPTSTSMGRPAASAEARVGMRSSSTATTLARPADQEATPPRSPPR